MGFNPELFTEQFIICKYFLVFSISIPDPFPWASISKLLNMNGEDILPSDPFPEKNASNSSSPESKSRPVGDELQVPPGVATKSGSASAALSHQATAGYEKEGSSSAFIVISTLSVFGHAIPAVK